MPINGIILLLSRSAIVALLAAATPLDTPSQIPGDGTVASHLDSFVGCWALQVGEWEPRETKGLDWWGYHPPRQVKFTSEQMQSGRSARQNFWAVRARSGNAWPVGRWQPTGEKELRVFWSSGFEGLRLELQIRADSLIGKAVAYGDVINMNKRMPEAPVVAERVQCLE